MTEYIDATNAYLMRLVHDLVPCGEVRDAIVAIGMIPPGDDSLTSEHYDSHARLAAVARHEPHIRLMARLCAEIISARLADDATDLEEAAALHDSVTDVIAVSSTAILANLIQDEQRGALLVQRPTGGLK